MKKSKALKNGSTIGIAASSSPFDRNAFMHGVHLLEKLGFKTFYRQDIFDQNRYLAGNDERRAEELMHLFRTKKIDAIMFARGGYGSQRIIPLLDEESIQKHKKPIVGFSDLTPLLNYLKQKLGVPSFYGPVITQLGKNPDDMTKNSLIDALTKTSPMGMLPSNNAKTLKAGFASGKLVGGCLSLINSSIGTPYEIDTHDTVLFIEDIGEKVYVLDRMLTQLKNGLKLKTVKGIIFGKILPPEGEPHNIEEMILDVMNNFAGPIIFDYPSGHTSKFVTLPLGVNVELNADFETTPSLNVMEEALA
ncbi:MAG: LD-carboxypeptidase [Pseudomonadota bacterium]